MWSGAGRPPNNMLPPTSALKRNRLYKMAPLRFNMTPPALFAEMVRTAETLLHRQAAETVVRRVCVHLAPSLLPHP